MKKIIFILFVLVISCKNQTKNTLISIKNNKIQNTETKYLEKKQKIDTLKVIDSLHKGIEFYTLNEFKSYQYIEIEPYEEFLTDDKNNMYHIVIYKKEEFKYALLVVLEKNINEGELSPIWKKTKKKIVDIIKYPTNYANCWYYSLSDNINITDQLFVIANIKNIDLEDDSRLDEETDILIKKQGFKVWKVDFNNNKFEEIKDKEYTNEIHCF